MTLYPVTVIIEKDFVFFVYFIVADCFEVKKKIRISSRAAKKGTTEELKEELRKKILQIER